ncbi:MAG: aminopeptidase P family protein [Dehalococcoidia bacterium]
MTTPASTSTTAARLERVRARFDALAVDAILVTTPSNRRWVSGFTGSAGVALVTRYEARFATDSRYWEQVAQQSPEFALVQVSGANTGVAPAILEGLGGLRVGFEAAHLSYASYEAWTGALAETPAHSRPALVPAPRAIEDLRMVKDAEEVDALTRAVHLGDDAFRHAASQVTPGMTEKQVAWLIQEYAVMHGAEDLSFSSIVAGGAHGSLPHWRASDAPLEAETGVVIDMGVIVDGYCSDLTRTIWLGDRPSDEFKRVYDVVLTAQETAEERIEAGMPGSVGHEIAHEVIRRAGYGERFGHGLGHGVGLDIHEDPRLAPSGEIALEDGHVVTVEPGIYIPGWGGVRIEDQCVMEDGRLRTISTAPKVAL